MKYALNELNKLLPSEQVQVINSLPIPAELEPIINSLMEIKGMGRMSAIEVLFRIGVQLERRRKENQAQGQATTQENA